jgi:hypothetical protein
MISVSSRRLRSQGGIVSGAPSSRIDLQVRHASGFSYWPPSVTRHNRHGVDFNYDNSGNSAVTTCVSPA